MTLRHRQYAAYLFDLDGTLLDTAPDLNAAINHTIRTIGLPPVDLEMTRHWVGHGARVMIEQALQFHGHDQADVDDLWQIFISRYEKNVAELTQPYPMVRETLDALRANGAKLAVVTNKIERLTRPLLDAMDMEFDLIVGGDTADQPKPHPDPVIFCLEHFEISPHEALFVGDSKTDADAAKAAGTPLVLMRDGYNHGIDVTTLGADEVIVTMDEIIP